MRFMSAEHVEAMNEVLLEAPTVRQACARLGRPRVLSYLLTGGPDGEAVHWTICFDHTIRFLLEEARSPDVRLVGDWKRMIGAVGDSRTGTKTDPGLSMEGDVTVLAEIEAVLEVGRSVATIQVEVPAV